MIELFTPLLSFKSNFFTSVSDLAYLLNNDLLEITLRAEY